MAINFTPTPIETTGPLATAINNNFSQLQSVLLQAMNRVYSDNNSIDTDIDMNGHTLMNLPTPVHPTSPLRLQDMEDKQDVLISGENIKTINNESILGPGNIVITGGGGGGGTGGGAVDRVIAGTGIIVNNSDFVNPVVSVAVPISQANANKLETVQVGATANQTDSYLLNRSNHTGSQPISSVSGLSTALSTINNTLDNKVDTSTFTNTVNTLTSDINARQEELVSGVNVKTINGLSILGSGNLDFGGGGGSGATVESYIGNITIAGLSCLMTLTRMGSVVTLIITSEDYNYNTPSVLSGTYNSPQIPLQFRPVSTINRGLTGRARLNILDSGVVRVTILEDTSGVPPEPSMAYAPLPIITTYIL